MNYAFIKENKCSNVGVFDSDEGAMEFKQSTDWDDIVLVKEGFGIGDEYKDGIWSKQEITETPQEPTETEMIMLAIADLDLQRELDKTETQLAIAELAETLLGGI